jgi:hypothetical protein
VRRVDGPKAGQTLSDLMDYTKGKLVGIDMVKKFKSTLKQKFILILTISLTHSTILFSLSTTL